MKAKGLGTGLGALFGDAANTADDVKKDFEYIPIIRIEPHPEQPRSQFEQDKIDELTNSIREHGVLTPLLVRQLETGDYQIIAGERRWRAARNAGLMDVPARVIDADDQNAMVLALVENLQREDLTPIEEARGFSSLSEDFGMTQEEIAARVSKSRPAVANALRLLTLPEELISMVENGDLSAGSARALLALKDFEKMHSAALKAFEEDMSVREVEEMVKHLLKAKPESTQPKVDSGTKEPDVADVDYIADAQKQLEGALGRRVKIKQDKEKGRIEIEYYDPNDFNILFDTLIAISSLHPGKDSKPDMET